MPVNYDDKSNYLGDHLAILVFAHGICLFVNKHMDQVSNCGNDFLCADFQLEIKVESFVSIWNKIGVEMLLNDQKGP